MPRNVLLSGALIAVLALSGRHVGAADALEPSIRVLRRAVGTRADRETVALLRSLRQLHDPTLQALFYKLVQHQDWRVQVQAVMGLADLDENGRVDPWLVTQVRPPARQAILAESIDRDMLSVESMRDLLDSGDLDPMGEMLIVAELVTRDEAIETARLKRLSERGDLSIAALAAALLAEQGDETAFDAVLKRIESLPARDRERRIVWLIDAARQYELTALADWIARELEHPDADEETRFIAIMTLLDLEPDLGLAAWNSRIAGDPSQRRQIRFGLLLLTSDPPVPASTYDALDSDDALVTRMVAAGRALSGEGDLKTGLKNLLDLDHALITSWALSATSRLDDADAREILLHVLDTMESHRVGRAERTTLAVHAVELLNDRFPDVVQDRLMSAEDDSQEQETYLLALLNAPSPQAGEVAAGIRRIGAGRADSLALLLLAREAATLDDMQIRQLGMIASGGGRVDVVLQIRAAWLYLRHTNRIETALNRLFTTS